MNNKENISNNSNEAGTREMPGTGFLIVRVAAGGIIPLSGAIVRISGENGAEYGDNEVDLTLRSDIDGKTEKIPLPAPAKELSEVPGMALSEKPFAEYNIEVSYPGYSTRYFQNVPVFDSITSIQQANLVPLSKNGQSDNASYSMTEVTENENPTL